jgi:hypothetical protein
LAVLEACHENVVFMQVTAGRAEALSVMSRFYWFADVCYLFDSILYFIAWYRAFYPNGQKCVTCFRRAAASGVTPSSSPKKAIAPPASTYGSTGHSKQASDDSSIGITLTPLAMAKT